MARDLVLVAESVGKSFGRVVALRDVSLAVPAGCVFGVIGPNGSGKTTFIRLALDLIRPTSGSIKLLGRDSHGQGRTARRNVSYLPGNLVLPARSTGREFLSDLAELRHAKKSSEINDLADLLDADLSRPMGDLSLGNRRKIGLIAALAHDPKVLFLDEPTSGLDPLVQQRFRQLVRTAAENGSTVFLSSHVLDEVQHVSDMVTVIREGSVVTTGAVSELTSRLTRRFAANFSTPVSPLDFQGILNVADVSRGDHDQELIFHVRGPSGKLFTRIADFKPIDIRGTEPDLEDAFVDLYRDPKIRPRA